ncbi:MAG: (2Fe-2S)-binding protein [Nitrospiraceae bacterium]|nr:MAG: (2Fe-2S)-binding protein [Nitrospiraceae bacterium]
MAQRKIKIKINGVETVCEKGDSILTAAQRVGVPIPTLCHDDRLEPYGGCRLCSVEVKHIHRLLPACTTPVKPGMEVITESATITRIRKRLVSLMLSNHPNDCMHCEKAGECRLQDLAYEFGVDGSEYGGERWDLPIREANPFITYEPNKCVTCGRCIRICSEVVMAGTIDWVGKGFYTLPDTAFRRPRSLSNCEFCGQCVSTCPTGALTDKKGRGKGRVNEMQRVRTTCGYCGTGCTLYLNVKGGTVVKVTSAFDGPVNQGNLCIKGRYGYDFIHSAERIRAPLIRKGDGFHEATWDEALDLVAKNFRKVIKKHGNKSVGAFSSSRCTNEENFLLAKFVRTVFRSNNVDNCARV